MCIVSVGLILFLFESSIYNFLFHNFWVKYWVIIPCGVYVLSCLLDNLIKIERSFVQLKEWANLIAFLALSSIIFIEKINYIYLNYYSIVCFAIVLIAIGSLILVNFCNEKDNDISSKDTEKVLFNLFYLNTPKAHEIAMLIDNKIMNSIEKECISSSTQKAGTTVFSGNKDTLRVETGYSVEDVSKQKVLESFEVKHTKSLMLQKIYNAISNQSSENMNTGELVLLRNVELKQINVDDTVMILNVLQDSKLKNQSNDDIEINLNKMMDKMLDDFTIDYTFSSPSGNKACIIRLPYKSDANFENGYQHNDLQLGKLSVIGISRGDIDFSKEESISSKFLELLSTSYNQELEKDKKQSVMKLSCADGTNSEVYFDFEHKKYGEKSFLIDVIAIIQEINIKKE